MYVRLLLLAMKVLDHVYAGLMSAYRKTYH